MYMSQEAISFQDPLVAVSTEETNKISKPLTHSKGSENDLELGKDSVLSYLGE